MLMYKIIELLSPLFGSSECFHRSNSAINSLYLFIIKAVPNIDVLATFPFSTKFVDLKWAANDRLRKKYLEMLLLTKFVNKL